LDLLIYLKGEEDMIVRNVRNSWHEDSLWHSTRFISSASWH